MSDLYHGEHPTDMTPTEARAAVERLDRLIEQAEMAASAQLERARPMSDDKTLVERLRRRVNKPDGTKRKPSPRELEAADRIEAQAAEIARLREAVVKAEHTFRWYGDMHAAKPDPDKAKRNYDLANEMRQALGEQP